jgi:hypothetical protein
VSEQNQALFDPTDPFQGTIEDLRQTLALSMAAFMQAHRTYRQLDDDQQVQAIIIGGTVALMGVLSALVTPETREGLVEPVQGYIPDAWRIAQDIILNGERIMAGGVQ